MIVNKRIDKKNRKQTKDTRTTDLLRESVERDGVVRSFLGRTRVVRCAARRHDVGLDRLQRFYLAL